MIGSFESPKRHAMKTIELIGDIDEQHRLHAEVPKELPAGQIRLILLPGEDEAGGPPIFPKQSGSTIHVGRWSEDRNPTVRAQLQ